MQWLSFVTFIVTFNEQKLQFKVLTAESCSLHCNSANNNETVTSMNIIFFTEVKKLN